MAIVISLAGAGVLFCAQAAIAQPGGGRGGFRDREDERSDDSRGERSGGRRGFDRGRFDRRAFDREAGDSRDDDEDDDRASRGRRGGRGGGFGRDRRAGMQSALRSMDANGDGVLARNEMPEQRWRMVEMMARRAGVSAEGAVRIEDLANAAPGDRGRGDRRDRRGDGRRGGGEDNPMAFGRPPGDTPTVAGFGDTAEADQPIEASPEELERAEQGVEAFLSRLDRNRDGELDEEEARGFPGGAEAADADSDGTLSRTELLTWNIQVQRQWRERGFGGGDDGGRRRGRRDSEDNDDDNPRGRGRRERERSQGDDAREEARASNESGEKPADNKENTRRSYRFTAAADRLPAEAKGWITQRDRDGDGQVAMHEFSRSWNDGRVREFARYDRNEDGIITGEEYVASR